MSLMHYNSISERYSLRLRCDLPKEYQAIQRWLSIFTINAYNVPISTTFVCTRLIPRCYQVNKALSVEGSLLFA